jgi:predicted aspartyl protease
VIAAFWLGMQRGLPEAEVPAESVAPPSAAPASAVAAEGFDPLLARGDWPALAGFAVANADGERLVATARSLGAAGRTAEGIALLEAYLDRVASTPALFALSDLLLMQGRMEAALEPLFAVLDYPDSATVAAEARHRLSLIVNVREQQLVNVDDLPGLVDLYRGLVEREPGYDGHRLKLAAWLLRSGQVEEARAVFRQVGYVGVTDAEREALAREFELVSAPLPFERSGDGYFADAAAGGRRGERSIRLLVDTGASMTGISAALLERLGAERMVREAQVHTAGGVTRMPTYRLNSLKVGEVDLGEMVVLGLPKTPGDADGLLGMDVLDQLPKLVGMPGDAR